MSASTAKPKSKRIPVFVFPEELRFVEKDQSSHKQVLTLYNPYDFNVKFEVFCNAPTRYAVVESKGLIKAQCCVDMELKKSNHIFLHSSKYNLTSTVALGEGPYDTKDKFRVDIFYDKRLIGRKLIPCTLTKEIETENDSSKRAIVEDFRMFGANGISSHPHPRRKTLVVPRVGGVEHGPSLWLVVMALLCLLVLLLPLEGESSSWPLYLHISVNQKLIASFALGLVTMAILKS